MFCNVKFGMAACPSASLANVSLIRLLTSILVNGTSHLCFIPKLISLSTTMTTGSCNNYRWSPTDRITRGEFRDDAALIASQAPLAPPHYLETRSFTMSQSLCPVFGQQGNEQSAVKVLHCIVPFISVPGRDIKIRIFLDVKFFEFWFKMVVYLHHKIVAFVVNEAPCIIWWSIEKQRPFFKSLIVELGHDVV